MLLFDKIIIMKSIEVIKAEYITDYKIHLWFNNNVDKIVDLYSSLKGVVFEPLKNVENFKKFKIKYNTIEWV